MTSRHLLRALRSRNYQLFFSGQLISLVGTWMQTIAMSWLVYRMTKSAFLLGVIGFSSQISAFFVTPIAGVWADCANRRKLVIVTQSLAMLQAFLLAALVLTHVARIWHIIALSVVLGMINSFDMPVRQSFTVEMVETKEDLGNAIALNSMLFNIARFIGPPLAGAVIAVWGEGVCFLLNGISYVAVIVALCMMRMPVRPRMAAPDNILMSIREGFEYIVRVRPIRTIMLLMALVSLVVFPYAVLMPIFAAHVLHGSSRTLGFLMGAVGVGALGGAIYVAANQGIDGIGKRIAVATALMGAGIIALSLARSLWLSSAILLCIGFGMMVHMASSNTFVQTIVEDSKRGRVMGFYILAFIGLAPFGSLFAGWMASVIGTPATLMVFGFLCLCGSLLFTSRLKQFNRSIAAYTTASNS